MTNLSFFLSLFVLYRDIRFFFLSDFLSLIAFILSLFSAFLKAYNYLIEFHLVHALQPTLFANYSHAYIQFILQFQPFSGAHVLFCPDASNIPSP